MTGLEVLQGITILGLALLSWKLSSGLKINRKKKTTKSLLKKAKTRDLKKYPKLERIFLIVTQKLINRGI